MFCLLFPQVRLKWWAETDSEAPGLTVPTLRYISLSLLRRMYLDAAGCFFYDGSDPTHVSQSASISDEVYHVTAQCSRKDHLASITAKPFGQIAFFLVMLHVHSRLWFDSGTRLSTCSITRAFHRLPDQRTCLSLAVTECGMVHDGYSF